MVPEELRATARVGGRVMTDVASVVEGVHRAVARRAFGVFGPVARPASAAHEMVSSVVYKGVRGAGAVGGAAVGEALFLAGRGSAPAGSRRWGNQAVAVLNAVAGDRLAREGNALAISMAVRLDGDDVRTDSAGLREAFPNAGPRLAVLLHGLGETEMSWTPAVTDGRQVDYGRRLRSELGYTPVYVRYNTGRHVSENGSDLAALLEALASSWPVAPQEILLMGHSMGGLVIRSACHHAAADSRPWVELVRHAFYLGTPHLGAPLARAAGLAGWAANRLPETRPFASLINGWSDGVKDLRFGYLVDEEWMGCDPDRCRANHRTEVPLLESANHYVFGVTVSADPSSLAGRLAGDLLVQPASAHGRRRRGQHIPFPFEGRRRIGGLHYFDLLHHPAIWAEIEALLVAGP